MKSVQHRRKEPAPLVSPQKSRNTNIDSNESGDTPAAKNTPKKIASDQQNVSNNSNSVERPTRKKNTPKSSKTVTGQSQTPTKGQTPKNTLKGTPEKLKPQNGTPQKLCASPQTRKQKKEANNGARDYYAPPFVPKGPYSPNSRGAKAYPRSTERSFKKGGSKWQSFDLSKRYLSDTTPVITYLQKKLTNKVEDNENGVLHIGLLAIQENQFRDEEITKLIDFLLVNKERILIKIVYFFKNLISDSGAEAIAQYIREAPNVPKEIHLSHNAITLEGAKKIFDAVKFRNYPIEVEMTPQKMKYHSLWVRLEWNVINVEQLFAYLDEIEIIYCIAEDRTKCGPGSCISKSNGTPQPALHLYAINFQYKPIDDSPMLANTKLLVDKLNKSRKEERKRRLSQDEKEKITAEKAKEEESAESLPLFLFLDTNAVITMLDIRGGERDNRGSFAFSKAFTWKNILEKAKKGQFGYKCWNYEGQKVCLMLTNTVMQEVDHQKKKLPHLRAKIVNELQSEEGYLASCVQHSCLEMLGAHQGERLIKERNRELINLDTLQDPNQYNDVMLINVALFWNQEIGENGRVILITNDRGCLRMAKEHNLPATSLSDLDKGLIECGDVPWTAEVIRKCIPNAMKTVPGGSQLASPLRFTSLYDEIQSALDTANEILAQIFTWKSNVEANTVEVSLDTDWTSKEETEWAVTLPLIPGVYKYSFWIDGEETHDFEEPYIVDKELEKTVNVLHVTGIQASLRLKLEENVERWQAILDQRPKNFQ